MSMEPDQLLRQGPAPSTAASDQVANLLRKPIKKWSNDDVCGFLLYIGLPAHSVHAHRNEITGKQLARELPAALQALELHRSVDREYFLCALLAASREREATFTERTRNEAIYRYRGKHPLSTYALEHTPARLPEVSSAQGRTLVRVHVDRLATASLSVTRTATSSTLFADGRHRSRAARVPRREASSRQRA
jgi:hypothetical protein